MRQKKERIVLTPEQEQFFIQTWENNDGVAAYSILCENLGISR